MKLFSLAPIALIALAHAEPVHQPVADAMKQVVEAKEVAGVVTLVADPDRILHLDAQGSANLEKSTALRTDALFWIASMTKPVTATAVMMMVEEGKVTLDEPVSTYIPEFRDLKDSGGKPVSITLRQCLDHTSGLAEISGEEANSISTLKELVPLVVAKPVNFAPGTQWRYCQSSINTAARVVEIVSGKTFPEFLEARLFQPLGMKDTSFYPTEEQVGRLATSYAREADGTLKPVPIGFLGNRSLSDRKRYPLANGGLFSTASDYSLFARMILRGGEWNGKRYLKEDSVRTMTTVQTGELATGFTPGNGWGVGWCVIRQPQGVTESLSPGSFGHGGAFGTQAWIDPVRKRVHLLMLQRSNLPNSDASSIRAAFHKAAAGL